MNPSIASDVALVLETNNLRGGDARRTVESLERLLRHLRGQTVALSNLAELVITHDGLSPADRERIENAAGIPVSFVALPDPTGYYQAKNLGFDATRAPIVAFADADCWPDPAWLDALIQPFTDRAVKVVAGRTTYRDGALGAAATAVDFLYFPTPNGHDCTRNFYANNVAFRRETFARFRYIAAPDVYRGHCQHLGFRLHAAGIAVHFAERARTVHRLPDSAREFLRLRLLRGADAHAIAPALLDSALPAPLRPVSRLRTVAPYAVLAGRLAFGAFALGRQGTAPLPVPHRAAAFIALVGITLADGAGIAARATRLTDFGVRDGDLRRAKLSYHGNRDRLRAAT